MTILETPRLLLRPARQSDAVAVQEHFGRWEIIQHLAMAVPWPYPEDGAERFLEMRLAEVHNGPDRLWAITEKGRDQLIGVLEYMAEDKGAGNRGFWLGVPWQGRGYMTEAVSAFHDYAFNEMGLERIIVENSVSNPRSRRIKEKTGARFLGIVPFHHRDGSTESERWEVTAEGWAAFRRRHPA